MGFRDLRHTYAAIEMTMRYAHLTPDSKKEAARVFDQMHRVMAEGHMAVTATD